MWAANSEDTPGIENNVLDFNFGFRELKKDTAAFNINQVNISMSDKEGNLLFYFNGCYIAGADHQLIENGDSINYGEWWGFINDCSSGYTGPQNSLALPDPANENGYYIFHKEINLVSFPTRETISHLNLRYTYVDMSENNGKGKVLEKNRIYFQDTIMGTYFHATKHANGKDWWMVELKETPNGGKPANTYFVFLLDENGPRYHHQHEMGPKFTDNTSAGGAAKFSPDGERYAFFNYQDGLLFADFDRESGQFSNEDFYDIKKNGVGGIEWSPSGRYLYVSTWDSLYQYDTWAEDIGSTEVLVDVYDGFAIGPFKSVFSIMQRGPDCRIYMCSRSSSWSIHVINDPDEPAPYCNFVQRGLDLFTSTGTISLPNFPNYRLDNEPVCDPGILTSSDETVPPNTGTKIKVFPNPATDRFTISSSEVDRTNTVRIVSMTGNIMWSGEQHEEMDFATDSYPAGVYFVQLLNDRNVVVQSEKLVIVI